jgi:hypothetical protein
MTFFSSGIKKSNTRSGIRTPTGIDDVFAWFDPNQGMFTVAPDITRWESKMNDGIYVSASSGAGAPELVEAGLNGNNTVSFDGVQEFTNDTAGNALATLMTGSQDCTITMIAKSTVDGGVDCIVGWGEKGNTSDGTDVTLWAGNVATRVDKGSGVSSGDTVGLDLNNDNEFHIITVTFRGAAGEWLIKVDGKLQSAGSVSATDQDAFIDYFQIGKRPRSTAEQWVGEMAEIMIYDRILTSEEIVKVEEYLFDKYFNPTNLSGSVAYFKASDTHNIDLEQT